MKNVLLMPFKALALILTLIIGQFSWLAPPWWRALTAFCQRHKIMVLALLLGSVLSAGIYVYVSFLPKPLQLKTQISQITVTADKEQALPDSLSVEFVYDLPTSSAEQMLPSELPSAARIDLVGKKVLTGIQLSPKKSGVWTWSDDRTLRFVPETDWPADTQYTIVFTDSIFADKTHLSHSKHYFSTPPLSMNVSDIEFYQDPQNSAIRRVVATVASSHPIDPSLFEQQLTMELLPKDKSKKNFSSSAERAHKFTVTYSQNARQAYIQSAPVTLPKQANFMRLALPKGLSSRLGGQLSTTVEKKVLIPDVYSFLKVNHLSGNIVRNAQDEPEQVLTIEFTDEINQTEVLDKLSFYQLPQQWKKSKRFNWRVADVDAQALHASQLVPLTLIANQRASAKTFNFKLDLPEQARVYVKLEPGLTSINQFVHAPAYAEVLRMPDYPQEIKIAGEGAVLMHSGSHQFGVVTRGVDSLQYSIGKLLPDRINHLVSQTRGDISNPEFDNWRFTEQDIVHYTKQHVELQQSHAKKANYSAFDLSRFLPNSSDNLGLFLVDVKAWDAQQRRVMRNVGDKRLILVTDLGVVVKNNADQSHHVFVQSIADGLPVAGARVELLGKNGLAILNGVTDARGHVRLPSTKDYRREKTPTVYVVRTDNDMSFIPFARKSRQINLSKFDIGGVKAKAHGKAALDAYLFSDRGIYRPGETVNLGLIVKNSDFSAVAGIPLELVIRGPRNNSLKVVRYQLPDKGFSDFQYATEASSDTGQYNATLYLVRDNKYRAQQLGNTTFKVEEFQPDTLKIQSHLQTEAAAAWSDKATLNASISLRNLFGEPAQDRKLSATVNIQPNHFSFAQFKDYQFTEYAQNEPSTKLLLNKKLPEQRTDADGLAQYAIDLSAFNSGTYQLNFSVEGFDQAGGRSVRANNTILLSPLQQIVGYKADGDLRYIKANSDRKIHFIAIDKSLQQQASQELSLRLLEIQSISTLVKQANGTYKYQTIKQESEVSKAHLQIPKNGFDYVVDTSQYGDYALEILDDKQRRLSRVELTVVGAANLAGKLEKNAELQLQLNQADYVAGETIEMQVKAPYAGTGLISIESDKVHSFKWFSTEQESSIQTITVPEGIEGTAYVNVAFVRDASSPEVFTSPLSYAVQPFSIDKSKREIAIQLHTPEQVRPGKPMAITFSTSKPAKIAVFAVDEGILQVANYTNPDPLAHYLRKQALGVDTLQILDLILPDFDLVKQLSASGGGSRARRALAKNLNPFARATDRPAVFWSGIYDASPNSDTVQFAVPNTFAGELRVMAVAVAEDAIGVNSLSTVVRGPFVISPNVLTTAAPNDEFDVTVGLANLIKGSGKAAAIELQLSASEHLEIVGPSVTALSIDEGSEGQSTFRVRARQKLGAAKLTFTATHKDEVMYRTTELSVRPATLHYSDFTSGFAKQGPFDLPVQRALLPSLAEQSIAASASPLLMVNGLSAYLESYPHGCTEQIVSKVFPIVGLLAHPAYAPHLPEVKRHFTYLIDKLRERQLPDGGFMFWPGGQSSMQYPSIYVMHFLLEARELGYPVPTTMLQQGQVYLESIAQRVQAVSPTLSRTTSRSNKALAMQRERANAIYLLTRFGVVTSHYLIDLQDDLSKNPTTAWKQDILSTYMAATYQLLQKDDVAETMLKTYQLNSTKYQTDSDFHSPLSTDAQYVYLLAKHFAVQAKQLGEKSILRLTDKIQRGEYNTISAAYAMLALGAYSQLVLPATGVETIEFAAIDAQQQRLVLNALAKPFVTADYAVGTEKLVVASATPLFYVNVQSGFDRDLPQQSVQQGLEIFREFVDADGNVMQHFVQGQEVTVRLKIRALDTELVSNVAVVDLLPGGFEVVRSSVPRTAIGWRSDYVDVREDRVVYYGSFGRQITELSYRAKLTAAGQFTVPPAYAESMYDRATRAMTKATHIEVVARP